LCRLYDRVHVPPIRFLLCFAKCDSHTLMNKTRLCGFARRGAAEAVMISQISLEGVQYVRLGLWNYERAFWNRRIGVYWIIWCNRARRHDSSWSSLCMRKFIFSWNGEYNIHHGIYPLFLYDIKKIRFHLLADQSSSFIFLYRIRDQLGRSPSLN